MKPEVEKKDEQPRREDRKMTVEECKEKGKKDKKRDKVPCRGEGTRKEVRKILRLQANSLFILVFPFTLSL